MILQPHTIPRNPLPKWVSDIASKTSITGRLYEVSPGVWYPSVTTVLGQSDPEKTVQLNAWKQAVGFAKAAQISKQATDRGTAVHELVDDWLNDKPISMDENYPVEIAVPTRQLISSLRTNLTEIWINEQAVWSHELKTAGRIDLVGKWKLNPAIIDFKTASKPKTEKDILQYFLQATTYSLCWYEITGFLIENIVIIIGNDKSFKPQLFETTIYPYITKVQKAFASYDQKHAKKSS